jgi:hypothetical protein
MLSISDQSDVWEGLNILSTIAEGSDISETGSDIDHGNLILPKRVDLRSSMGSSGKVELVCYLPHLVK